MKNQLEYKAVFAYGGSREYTNKQGEVRILHKFIDGKGNAREYLIKDMPELKAGAACICDVVIYDYWVEAEKRYRERSAITHVEPYKK